MKRVHIVTLRQVKESSKLCDIESTNIGGPESAAAVIKAVFNPAEEDREVFGILALDAKNKINGAHVVSMGSLNSSLVHPREIYKLAILNNAASIILWHNHPSGDPTPSKEDIAVTNRVKEAGTILGIEVVDHIVVGDGERYVSFREKGIL